ncbi:hypothetical protein [Burkholderia metallica]|nr:hypothetical protein [Burkholderia metallica]
MTGTKLIAARKELAFAKKALDELKTANGPDTEALLTTAWTITDGYILNC